MRVNLYSQESMDLAEHIVTTLCDRFDEQVQPHELGTLVCGLTLALLSFKLSLAHLGIIIDQEDLEVSLEEYELN